MHIYSFSLLCLYSLLYSIQIDVLSCYLLYILYDREDYSQYIYIYHGDCTTIGT